MNLNGILIGSEDPQRLVDYYTKLFGEPGWSEGGYTGWQIGSGYVTVGAPFGGQRNERSTRTCDLEHRDERREG